MPLSVCSLVRVDSYLRCNRLGPPPRRPGLQVGTDHQQQAGLAAARAIRGGGGRCERAHPAARRQQDRAPIPQVRCPAGGWGQQRRRMARCGWAAGRTAVVLLHAACRQCSRGMGVRNCDAPSPDSLNPTPRTTCPPDLHIGALRLHRCAAARGAEAAHLPARDAGAR